MCIVHVQVMEAIEKHRAAGAAMPAKLDRELQSLSEAGKRYCLCASLYDERRPMLECDYCNNWYHWECVGMDPPGDSEVRAARPQHKWFRPNSGGAAGVMLHMHRAAYAGARSLR
jgi:histone demethylase JARID1